MSSENQTGNSRDSRSLVNTDGIYNRADVDEVSGGSSSNGRFGGGRRRSSSSLGEGQRERGRGEQGAGARAGAVGRGAQM